MIDRILTKTVLESKDPLLGTEGMWVRIVMLYSQAGMVDNALKVFDEMLERKPWDFGISEELVRKIESREIGVKRIDEMRIKGDWTSYKYRILRHCEKKEYAVARKM